MNQAPLNKNRQDKFILILNLPEGIKKITDNVARNPNKIDAASLEISIAGSGDVKVNGRTENLEANVAGSGDISALNLKANNVNASIAGSGDVSVYCNGRDLKASIVGSGDLRYKGKAKSVKKSVMGSGDITKM